MKKTWRKRPHIGDPEPSTADLVFAVLALGLVAVGSALLISDLFPAFVRGMMQYAAGCPIQ